MLSGPLTTRPMRFTSVWTLISAAATAAAAVAAATVVQRAQLVHRLPLRLPLHPPLRLRSARVEPLRPRLVLVLTTTRLLRATPLMDHLLTTMEAQAARQLCPRVK